MRGLVSQMQSSALKALVERLGPSARGKSEADDGGRVQRVALDVKVINALDADHFDRSLESSQSPLAAYREQQMEDQGTYALCAARGIRYEPLVFSVQGGCESHAESILHQLAQAVADAEGVSKSVVKAELMEAIALFLSRSAASAVTRRRPPKPDFPMARVWRIIAGSGGLLEQ